MLACPIIHEFVYHIENVGQTISDPGQKLIVYTLPSIWQYPFFQNDINISVFCQNRQIQKIGFFVLYCLLNGPGPGPDRLGLKCYLAKGGTRVVGGGGGEIQAE